MARKKVNVSYDMEEDILHFFSGEKVQDSVEFDNFVFDIAHNGMIVGWQINNASKFLSSLYGTKISKEYFSSIKEAYMSNIHSREMVFVRVTYFVEIKKVRIEKELMSNMPELVVA